MDSLLNVALIAARAAARNLAHGVDRLDRLTVLDDSADNFATSMDRDAERTLIYQIRKFHPEHCIQSRLSGDCGGGDGRITWLLEPLAGNRNYLAGLPFFGVALACRVKNTLSHAALVFPQTNEEFSASRGQGAQLNSRRIRTGGDSRPDGRMIALHAHFRHSQTLQGMQQALHSRQALIRQSGCAEFDIVQVAANRLQGGWLGGRASIGAQAAGLVLREAGGMLAGEAGQPDWSSADETLFGNPRLLRELLRLRANLGPKSNGGVAAESKGICDSNQ
ncbi:MAG: hypothetical protein OXE54_08445 [Gammaproteobacteria bacterium]|nr:hypothetical protein [Gammaproteobacteria bacterium]